MADAEREELLQLLRRIGGYLTVKMSHLFHIAPNLKVLSRLIVLCTFLVNGGLICCQFCSKWIFFFNPWQSGNYWFICKVLIFAFFDAFLAVESDNRER